MATEVHIPSQVARPELDPDETVSVRLQSLQLSGNERRVGGSRWWRWLGWLMVLLVIGGGAAAFVQYRGLASAEVPEMDVVTFGEHKLSDNIFDQSGSIVAHTEMNITPRASGTIIEFPVEEGQHVKKGDLVARVDDTTFRVELQTALANLAVAQNNLEELQNGALPEEIEQAKETCNQLAAEVKFLNSEKVRHKELSKGKFVTDRDFEQLISKLEGAIAGWKAASHKLALLRKGPRKEKIAVAMAEVERAKSQVEKAQFWLDNTRLVSMVDGVVLEKKAQVGEDIHPELAFTSLCVIADMTNLEAEVTVPEQDIARIKIGQPCEVIVDAYPDHKYAAQVTRVLPRVNIARGVATLRVKITEPDDRLLIDMNCRVLFKRDPSEKPAEELPTIPTTAVLSAGEKSYVFVVAGDKIQRNEVQTGETAGDQVEIRSGLKKGDVVVTSAGASLQDGQTIRPRVTQAAG